MDPDLLFAIGILLGVFSIPAVLSALSERRAPRAAGLSLAVAALLLFGAYQENPDGYSIREIPDVFVRVVAKYLT